MRYGIFSDVHGNAEALEAVLGAYREEAIDAFISLGDIVGYGANPVQCLHAVQKLHAISIAGNHDWAAVDKFDIACFTPTAKQALLWTKRMLGLQEKNYLKRLPLVYVDENITCVHGSLADPADFSYIFGVHDAAVSFKLLKNRVCFIGHTHCPLFFASTGRRVSLIKESTVTLLKPNKYVCNVGSVGQPRDNVPDASFCVYDSKKMLVEIKRIKYNIYNAQNKIRKAGLPEFLAARLGQGR